MRILIVATKSPHPPRDGGRLALWHTLCGLAGAGHELTVVTPAGDADHNRCAQIGLPYRPLQVDVRPRGVLVDAARAFASGHSLGVARHAHSALRTAVADTIAQWRPHLVHAEQLHAFANCGAALDAGIPVVLRMQNVESAIRAQQARLHVARFGLHIEAARLRADERAAIALATRTVALTENDAVMLRDLGCSAAVTAIAPAFPAELPASAAREGDPAIALAGSSGWWPNTDGERWFLREVWPRVAQALPHAVLHLFGSSAGGAQPRIRDHCAPLDSSAAFPARAIAVVPLRAGSGIRMRILEAWARGLPVVATPAAASGLAVVSGNELLIARTPAQFAEAIAHIHADAALRNALVAGGTAFLRRHHDGARQTRELLAVYARARGAP